MLPGQPHRVRGPEQSSPPHHAQSPSPTHLVFGWCFLTPEVDTRLDMSTSASPHKLLDTQADGGPRLPSPADGPPPPRVWARYTRSLRGCPASAPARDSPACTQCTPQCCSGTCHVAVVEAVEAVEVVEPEACCILADWAAVWTSSSLPGSV